MTTPLTGLMTVGPLSNIVRIARNKQYSPAQLAQCFHGMTEEVAYELLTNALDMLDDGSVVIPPKETQP
jgi:hypothetical protein